MKHETFEVRYEYLYGRQFNARLGQMPVGYLPMGTLERHGDHLPMGLDVLKAQAICVHVAERLGGIVWPPHHYLGIHQKGAERATVATGWGNVYISETLAEDTLEELLDRAAELGFKVMVLYSGHYPMSQVDLIEKAARRKRPGMKVLAYTELKLLRDGDHAGLWETSLLAALRPERVRMDRIESVNRRQHGWDKAHDPAKADTELARKAIEKIVRRLRKDIRAALS